MARSLVFRYFASILYKKAVDQKKTSVETPGCHK